MAQRAGPEPADPDGRIRDLRGAAGAAATLSWPAGQRVVVSGLPGSGKSTLMRRVDDAGGPVTRIDSQEVRERLARRLPRRLPYAVYRPAVRVVHYYRLWRALRSSSGVLVHDCGRTAWVRRWLGRGSGYHLVLLDVPPATALAGQRDRGRTVSRYAFGRHRRALERLVAGVETGRLPPGCRSAVLLDRSGAGALASLGFTAPGITGGPVARER